jgi:hypothetical protein
VISKNEPPRNLIGLLIYVAMNQELNRFFNRIQNRNFSFTTDKFDEEYLIKLEKELQKEINKNLIKEPDPTCNWLKSIYYQIEEGQKYIHKTYVLDIQDRINDKSTKTIITKEEDENFQGANIILNALDLFKDLIIQNIKLVKPEIIKSKNTKVQNIPVITKPEEASEKNEKNELECEPKYLMPDGTKYSQAAIAFYLSYKYSNLIKDPNNDHYKVSQIFEIAKDFGWCSANSPQLIFDKYRRITKSDNQTNSRELIKFFQEGEKGYLRVEKYINNILDLLTPDEQIKAKQHLKTLELKIN